MPTTKNMNHQKAKRAREHYKEKFACSGSRGKANQFVKTLPPGGILIVFCVIREAGLSLKTIIILIILTIRSLGIFILL